MRQPLQSPCRCLGHQAQSSIGKIASRELDVNAVDLRRVRADIALPERRLGACARARELHGLDQWARSGRLVFFVGLDGTSARFAMDTRVVPDERDVLELQLAGLRRRRLVCEQVEQWSLTTGCRRLTE